MSDLVPDPLAVQILGREYKLRCRPEERELLIFAAQRLDAEMRAVRATGKALGSDRVAIMAALNIVHELLQLQARHSELQNRLGKRISDINELVDSLLVEEETA